MSGEARKATGVEWWSVRRLKMQTLPRGVETRRSCADHAQLLHDSDYRYSVSTAPQDSIFRTEGSTWRRELPRWAQASPFDPRGIKVAPSNQN